MDKRCHICDFQGSIVRPVSVADRELNLCGFCSGSFAHMPDDVRAALPECLHLLACAVELYGSYDVGWLAFAFQQWSRRLDKRIQSGVFRDGCACSMCREAERLGVLPHDLDIFDDDDDDLIECEEIFAEDISLPVLRSMNKNMFLISRDGSQIDVPDEIKRRMSQNREETSRPPLGRLAEKLLIDALNSKPDAALIAAREREAVFQRRGFELFGPLGEFEAPDKWIDGWGEVHRIPFDG